jgi:hypothetical protein
MRCRIGEALACETEDVAMCGTQKVKEGGEPHSSTSLLVRGPSLLRYRCWLVLVKVGVRNVADGDVVGLPLWYQSQAAQEVVRSDPYGGGGLVGVAELHDLGILDELPAVHVDAREPSVRLRH